MVLLRDSWKNTDAVVFDLDTGTPKGAGVRRGRGMGTKVRSDERKAWESSGKRTMSTFIL